MWDDQNKVLELAANAEKKAESKMISKEISMAIHSNGNKRPKTLAAIAEKQAKSGDRDGAKATFEVAISSTKQMDLFEQIEALIKIAEKQAEVEFLEAAIATIKMIDEENYPQEVLVIIGEKQLETGRYDDAISTAKLMSVWCKNELFSKIGEKQLETGRYDDAISTANLMNDYWQINLFRDIAKKQAEAGQFENAISTTKLIINPFLEDDCDLDKDDAFFEDDRDLDKDDAYETIAMKQAEAGLIESAIATTKLIRDTDCYVVTIENLTMKLIETDQFKNALLIINLTEPDGTRARGFWGARYYSYKITMLNIIAKKKADRGYFKSAISTAKQIDDYYRSETLAYIEEKQKTIVKHQKMKITEKIQFKGESETFNENISETPFDNPDSIDI